MLTRKYGCGSTAIPATFSLGASGGLYVPHAHLAWGQEDFAFLGAPVVPFLILFWGRIPLLK